MPERIEDIVEQLLSYHPSADKEMILRAYVFAAKAHDGQLRADGEPYMSHPLSVAYILTQIRMDEETIAAGLLHDTVEDNPTVTVEEIERRFGSSIAYLVEGVTKITRIERLKERADEKREGISKSSKWADEERRIESIKKVILATAKDIRVLIIKLADRLHNMRTLEFLRAEKSYRIARETMDVFAPLAHRLGIYWLKSELEDRAFRWLQPQDYENIEKHLSLTQKEREDYINSVQKEIKKLLEDGGIKCEVHGRVKNIYSIYRKMKQQKISLDEVYDVIAFRVIVDTVDDCYKVLGIIHGEWTPIHGRIKDYIATPKPNMYQSLHTSVFGPGRHRMEIQIRTAEMNRIAEEGIAVHWFYKEKRYVNGSPTERIEEVDKRVAQRFAWVKRLLDWRDELSDPTEFLDALKVELYPEEVYIFTPKGDVIALPRGATPVDFAYRIHTVLGHECVGAKVNGVLVPLDYKIQSGDWVEIITSKGHEPNRDWLAFVKTSTARAKIRSHLRKKERETSVQIGKALLEKELKKHKALLSRLENQGKVDEVAQKLGLGSAETLFAHIGYGRLSAHKVVEALGVEIKGARETVVDRILKPIRPRKRAGIRIRGMEGEVMFTIAKCCNPVPGERIVGYITRGKGISIHAHWCPVLRSLNPERRVEVEWDEETEDVVGSARLKLLTLDKPGILAKITETIAKHGMNISKISAETTKDNRGVHYIQVEVRNIEQLQKMMQHLSQLSGVFEVDRVASFGRREQAEQSD